MEATAVVMKRTPDLIAAEINNIKAITIKMILHSSIEIGQRLVEAKSLVSHGEWGKWLEINVDYSQSTANNLMRIYEEYGNDEKALSGDKLNSQTFGNLSYTKAIALLAVPREDREHFMKENDVENMSTRELQKAIKERDEALKQLEDAKLLATEKSEEARKLLEEKQKAESDARLSEQVLRNTQEDVKTLQEALENEKEKSKKEIEKLESSISEIKNRLSEAQASGNNEEVERLSESLAQTSGELSKAQMKIEELERKLQEKPIEKIVEKIPDEIQKELEELRKKAGQKGAEAILKYKVFFEEQVKGFKDLLGSLAEIKEIDSESYEKRKNAMAKLLGKMSESL